MYELTMKVIFSNQYIIPSFKIRNINILSEIPFTKARTFNGKYFSEETIIRTVSRLIRRSVYIL